MLLKENDHLQGVNSTSGPDYFTLTAPHTQCFCSCIIIKKEEFAEGVLGLGLLLIILIMSACVCVFVTCLERKTKPILSFVCLQDTGVTSTDLINRRIKEYISMRWGFGKFCKF